MLRGGIRVGEAPTAGTYMRGLSRLLPFEANASQETFVAQNSPQGSPHLGVISPVSPAPLCSSPPSCRLHGFEGLACDQLATKGRGQHQEDIHRQVPQIVVSGLVLAPTAADLSAQDRQRFFAWLASRIADGEAITLLLQSDHFRLELVNLAAQASLPPIKRASVYKERMPDLMPFQIDHTGDRKSVV